MTGHGWIHLVIVLAFGAACGEAGEGPAALEAEPGLDAVPRASERGHAFPLSADATWSSWSDPVPLAGINTDAAEQRAALSKRGLSLYFHSNRPGGLGANDLWVARRACFDCPWESPVNLGARVNTAESNEAGPALSRDEHWLFFGSNRAGGHGRGDIWVSYRENIHDDLGWGAPVNLGPGVNTSAGESQPSYFENEGGPPQLFFTRAGSIITSELQPDGTWGLATAVPSLANFSGPSVHPNGLEIYVFELFKDHRIWHATRDAPDAPWSAPTELVELTPGVASVFQPFIHAHAHTEMLFVGGIPAEGQAPDLYVSTRTRRDPVDGPVALHADAAPAGHASAGTWSDPVPLTTLNTPASELAPALSPDGLTIYFASDRAGNTDIYAARRACRACGWGAPNPLPSPINGDANEAGPFLSDDGRLFFFNSNRDGNNDIYVARREGGPDGEWGSPTRFGAAVNTAANENHAHYLHRPGEAYAPDGAEGVLYFARGGGIRAVGLDADLQPVGDATLVAELDDPAFFDGAPSVTGDGLGIFFHSARPGSQPPDAATPRFDLWMSVRSSTRDRWSAPVNLGPGVNGVLEDFQPAISHDGRTLVFTRRNAEREDFDLWMTTRMGS
ncbi:MAG TPA: hypothetical protein VMM12_01430 [Longimicrobiales bacterium]|nr:hypothetical protein [Longimicrobiales bacterium]